MVTANLPHDWTGRQRIDPHREHVYRSRLPFLGPALPSIIWYGAAMQMLHPDEEYRDEEADDEAKRGGERRRFLQSVDVDADVSVVSNSLSCDVSLQDYMCYIRRRSL